MRIGVAQINPTVGDIAGNAELILEHLRQAEAHECALVVFPEMALTGYPPEDLLLKPAFVQDNLSALKQIAPLVKKIDAIIGFVDQNKTGRFNAAAWISKGKIRAVYHKRELPNYGVFDEQRYFSAGRQPLTISVDGQKIGLTICEDIWQGPTPLKPLAKLKPRLVLNISASPFHAGKLSLRHKIAREAAKALKAPVLYCNMTGAQDELVFDGGSFMVSAAGKVEAQCPRFESGLTVFEWDPKTQRTEALSPAPRALTPNEEIYEALVLGVRDYVRKNKFEKVSLGLSGGIDSSLVAAIAVDALGAERVSGVTMPSQFNLKETVSDAHRLAQNLQIPIMEIPIRDLFQNYLKLLEPAFKNVAPNIAEENLQARIRGNIMMALSNKFGWLILTTGNKSEVSTGYCTLYGDTAGGFAVLKDVLKTTVYELSRYVNEKSGREVIPESVIKRPPTAELRADQKDEDSLGPYAQLDPVVKGYVEDNKSITELSRQLSLSKDYVQKIISLIDRNEYKRRQAPPGVKITPRSFGRDHRMPITNRYKPSAD